MGFYKKKKIVYVDIKEFNKQLLFVRKRYRPQNILYREKLSTEPFNNGDGLRAFIIDKEIEISLSYKFGPQAITYICRKDGVYKEGCATNGAEAFSILQHYYKVPDMRKRKETKEYYDADSKRFVKDTSEKAILYFNPKYNSQRVKAIGYDLNSSYSAAMLNRMPDTSVKPRMYDFPKEGEIGFDEDMKVTQGCAKFVFPLMDTPFEKFVSTWYKRKKNKTSKSKKMQEYNKKAKGILNFSVGYLAKINPFIRNAILYYANKRITDLIDENTLLCNTDSIVSLVPRDDIGIGTNIGEFKVEHEGSFAYRGLTCQWNYDAPVYRGIAKSWFKKGWDLLKDPIPKDGNKYALDKEKLKLVYRRKKNNEV